MAVMAGDLVTRLGLDARKFQSGLADSQKATRSFSGTVVALFNPINLGFDAIVAKAAAAGLSIAGISQRIGTLAGIVDRSQQTGLSGKFLQQLAYAADQSGVPVDTLTTAVEKMNIVLGDAERGEESAAKALEGLGLNAAELSALSPEQKFMAIADAIGKLPTPAARASASVDVFGKSMSEMGLLLQDGQRGLRALMEEADKLNIGFSDEEMQKVAKADDAIARMQSTVSNIVSQIAVGMAPVFEQMSNSLTEIMPKIGEVARGIAEGIAGSLKQLGAAFDENALPKIKEFLTASADVVSKWGAMEGRWKFIGDLIGAAFGVAFEMIKLNWSQMLDDMLTATAEKAKALLAMLNPKTASIALADWINKGGADNTMSASITKLDVAQAKLENVLRRLEGKEELPLPVVGDAIKKAMPQGEVTEAQKQATKRAFESSFPGLSKKTPETDPLLRATNDQTKRLEDAFRSSPGLRVNIVSEF